MLRQFAIVISFATYSARFLLQLFPCSLNSSTHYTRGPYYPDSAQTDTRTNGRAPQGERVKIIQINFVEGEGRRIEAGQFTEIEMGGKPAELVVLEAEE